MQEQLNSATSEQLWSTFTHLKPDFVHVCKNIFGNYVAQKYLELGSEKLRGEVVKTLQLSITSLSMDRYGCRVVQKLLEFGAKEHKQLVMQQLAGSIIDFVYDQNGNHVVQKIIQCSGVMEIGFIAEEIIGFTYSLAMHRYGCRVIQRLLEKSNRRVAYPLLQEIVQHTIALSKNQYGNYIIQWIIKHCASERRDIVFKLSGRVAELSREKFASNVIEQAFKRSSQAQIKEMAEELLVDTSRKTERYSTLALLVNDKFGNYVIKTLLESSSGGFRQRLLRALNNCGKSEKDYGRNLLVKVRRMIRKSSMVTE